MIKTLIGLTIATLGMLLSGCATTSVFSSYPNSAKTVKQDLIQHDYKQAEATLKPDTTSADKILYLLELGRVQQLAGDYKDSLASFKKAIKFIDQDHEKAVVSLSHVGATGASFLVNDNVVPFAASDYEEVLVHQYQAMNYLALHDLSGALVEVRRADEVQKKAMDENRARLDEAEKVQKQHNYDESAIWQKKQFDALNNVAARVKSGFLNAYTFYVSGLLYELAGQDNDAYIDYKKAYQIEPSNPYLQATVLRLAQQLGMENDLNYYQKFLKKAKPGQAVGSGEGKLVILFESGFIPPKQQFGLPLPTGEGIVAIAIPYYNTPWQVPKALSIRANGKRLGQTAPLVSLQALAAKTLKDEMPWIIARQVARVIAKAAITNKLAKDDQSGIAALISSIYNVVSEQADLRSWLTLPDQAQLFQKVVPAGTLDLQLSSQGITKQLPLKIQAGHSTILWVIALGNRLVVHEIYSP